jgi:hypothetical protein
MSSGRNNTDDDRRSEIESDREALRVELAPQRERTQLEAAWLIGRLCNELRFQCQDAWLAFRDREPTRTARIWADLSLLVNDALPLGDVNAVTVELQDIRNLWDRRFQSEDHSEELGHDNEVLREHFDNGVDLPHGILSVDFISRAATVPAEIVSFLHTMLPRNFSEPLHWAFRLGCQADQVIHPPCNRRAVRIRHIESTESPQWQLASGPRPVWVIDRQWDVLESWPDAEWEQQVVYEHARLLCSLGIEPAPLTRELRRVSSAEILDELSIHIHDAELLSETDAQQEVPDTTLAGFTRRGERTCRSLELTIDRQRNEVTRTGIGSVSTLAPRLLRLLLHFLNRPDENTTTQWLAENWNRFSPRSQTCRLPSVHAAIGSLNTELQELLVEITSESSGYILSDLRRLAH